MQCLLALALTLGLVAAPLGVSAQVGDAKAAAESADTPKAARGLQRWHPDAYVDPATGATLSDAGESNFEIEYATPSKADAPLTAKEQEVRRAKIGLCVSIVPVVVGGVMAAVAVGPIVDFDSSGGSSSDSGGDAALYAGAAIAGVGAVSMIVMGSVLGVRKGELRRSKEVADRKVRWDLTRSRLVF
jgi:hypothetical protein